MIHTVLILGFYGYFQENGNNRHLHANVHSDIIDNSLMSSN